MLLFQHTLPTILLFQWIQVKESETDPLINAENGDSSDSRTPSWNSDKDLRA